jgi:hypothetical protein
VPKSVEEEGEAIDGSPICAMQVASQVDAQVGFVCTNKVERTVTI